MDARILVILALVATATAGPLNKQDSNKCATQCTESSKNKYNPGTTYVYDYKVDTESSIYGASEDSARLTLQTLANVEVLSPCEFSIQLRDTKLFHTDARGNLKAADRETEFRSEVEGSPLRFSFQDGVVEHVCAEKEDSVRSLNLKKGILSAFQNSMDDLTQSQNITETDVAGTCKAEYKLVSNGYYTTEVKKVKDILSCTDRLDYMTMLQGTPYKVPSDLQNLPIMKTTHECEQSFENGGVMKSSVCKESHVYRPFASGQNGGSTKVTQTLTYRTYQNGVSQKSGNVQSRSSLLFDHSEDHPTTQQARMTVEKKISEICDTTRFDVRPDTPRLFSEFVAAMKSLDKQDLSELHRLLKTKSMCPTNGKAYKFFHDALPMLGNAASVSLMTELINSEDVTGLEASAWLTSLSFVQNPTSSMLLDAKTLIDNKKVRLSAMLPVSSMANNFCKKTGTCSMDYSARSLMASLEKNIGYNCDASGDNFELILMTLKAIGNAGHSIQVVPVLNKCLTASSNPLEIRIAAAEAFRRMPCLVDDKDLWDTFTDKDLDSELRINSYMALMRCPTQETLGKMAAILNAEEDEQVGAFVYSHLTNLKESSDPHKQNVADAINNLALDKEFDLSPLKFSRNFEVSGLLNKINTGVTAESNLIWSNKVQLPRAISGNLTVQLFGQSMNILDFGGRFEGLEYLIKDIFGPYFNSEEKPAKFDADSIQGSFYGRLFGNEMLFMHSKTMDASKTPTYLDMLIKLANKQHVSLTHSVQFMDICMVIPTSAGLPIHMNINGTATVDLDLSGKMDLRKVGASPRSMDVDGEIRPSAALEITGSMYVDSFVTKTGLRMRNTMHTSTAMKGRIQLNRGQQLSVEIDSPKEKMEIFDASTKFVLLHDDMEQEQEMIKENRKQFKMCSSEQMTTVTGMELCGELSFANGSLKADSPYFPLTGPSSISVTLFKRDSHSGYKLFAKRVENKKASMAQISINTPGSQVNRAISLDLALNYKKQNIEMNMATPWKKVGLNGNLMNSKDMKSLSGSVVVDDKDTYAMTGELKMSQSKGKVLVNPMFELRRPGADNIQVTGVISYEKPMKSANVEISLSGVDKLPYTVKSAIINQKKEKSVLASISLDGKSEYSFKVSSLMNILNKKNAIASIKNALEVKSPKRQLMTASNNVDYKQGKSLKFDSSLYVYRVMKPASLRMTLLKTQRKYAANYKADMKLKASQVSGSISCNLAKKTNGFMSHHSKIVYTIPKVAKNSITLSGKLNDRSTKSFKSYIISNTMRVKRNPEYNSDVTVEVGHKKKLTSATIDLKYGGNKDIKKMYLLTTLSKKIANLKNAVVSYKLKAQAPAHGIDFLLDASHEHKPKMLDSNVKIVYAPKKVINAGITLKDKSNKMMKLNGNADLSWPGKKYSVNTDFNQKSRKQYAHTISFQSNDGTKHAMTTIYKMPKADSHDVSCNVKLDQMRPVTISGSTNLNWRNFAAAGEVKRGQDVYGFKTLSKISRAPSAKMSLELMHPTRRVTFDVSGGKSGSKYDGSIETAWDADNNKDQKMTLDGTYFHKSSKGSISVGGNVNFRSPFEKYEKLAGSMRYGNDASQHSLNGKASWAKNTISSHMTAKKPISLRNLQINGNIKTPFRGFRNAEIDIAHKIGSELSTVVQGDLGKETAKLSVLGQKTDNGYKGNMQLKSTIKNAENVALSASHSGKDGSCSNKVELNHNGKVYGYDLTMSHSGEGWQRKTSGDLVLTLKKNKIATHWDHKNTDAKVSTSVSSKWGNKRVMFDLSGTHKLSSNRLIKGAMKITSPWQPIQDIELNIDHTHGKGLIDSIAFLRDGSDKTASSLLKYKRGQNTVDFDFNMASPFNQDLTGKFGANYDSYPMTTSGKLQWAPKMKGALEGSLDLASWNNAGLNIKLTTPSTSLRNVVLKASNKKQNGAVVSKMNLDYGVGQNIDVETSVANGDKKMVRLVVNTPFKMVKSLNTGLSFNGEAHNFDSNVDFELMPTIGKFNGLMNVNLNSWKNADFNMEMSLPSRSVPKIMLKASNKKENREVVSKLNLDYGKTIDVESHVSNEHQKKMVRLQVTTPFSQMKSLNTGLNFNGHANQFDSAVDFEVLPTIGKFDGVMNWQYDNDLTGKLRIDTPFRDYRYFELTTSSNRNGGSRKSHLQAEYYPRQVFSLNTNYNFDLPLSFDASIRSPYPEFNDIGMSIYHNLKDSNMKSHAEVQYQSDKKVEADLNADWASTMDGSLVVKTPFQGFESNKIALRHRGQLSNFDSHGEIDIAQKNVVADASFKSGYHTTGTFTFSSPIPGLESVEVSLKKKGKKADIKGSAMITLNGDKFQTTFANKLTSDSLKTSLNLNTPYTKNFKFGLDHTGLLESFTNKVNVNYGYKVDIDTLVSFDLRGNDVNSNSVFKAKWGKSRNTAGLTFSKSGSMQDLSVSTKASLNKDDITVAASLRSTRGVDGSLQITTPFNNFKNTGMTVTYSGDLSDFSGDARINYMDNKSINGKVQLSTASGIKLTGDLTTPFNNFESTNVEVSHDNSADQLTGSAKLTTTIGEFGTGLVSYSKNGDLNNLVMDGQVTYNGKKMAELSTSHKVETTEVHNTYTFKSVATPDLFLSIDHSGDSLSFTNKAVGKMGTNMVSTGSNMRRSYNSISADSSLSLQINGFNKQQASISIQKDGPLDNCNMELSGKLNSEEAKLSLSRSGPLNNIMVSGSARYNQEAIDVTGSWKNTDSIEGSLKVVTPFDNYDNLAIVFSHDGKPSDFTSTLNVKYLDDQKINAKLVLNALSMNNIKFVSELKTPCEYLQYMHTKLNNNYNANTGILSGNAAIDTSINGFGTVSVTYSKSGDLNSLEVGGNAMRNGVEIAELTVKNRLEDKELHSSFDYKSTVTPHIYLTIDHSGDLTNLKSSAQARIGKKNVINGKVTLTQRSNTVDAEGKFEYTLKSYGSDKLSLTVHKEGELKNFNVQVEGKHGAKSTKLVGNLKSEDELSGDVTVSTPIDGYKNIGVSFKHSGSSDRFNCEAKVNVADGQEFSGKVDFYSHFPKLMEAIIELKTPIADYKFTKFEYRHEGLSDSLTCSSSLQYGDSQRVSYDMSATSSPKPEFTVTLKMPAQQYVALGSYEMSWPKYAVNGKVDAGEGRVVTLDASLDASQDVVGTVSLTTPVKGYNNVGLSFKHVSTSGDMTSDASITYKDGKVISGKAEATMTKNGGKSSLELSTPFKGYRFTRYESNYVFNKRIVKGSTKVEYGNEKISVDAYFKRQSPEFSLTISSPFSTEDIEAFASLDKTAPKYVLTSKLNPGTGKPFTVDAYFKRQSPEFSLTITSPFSTEIIEAYASLDKTAPKYVLTSKLNPGTGKPFTVDVVFDSSKDIAGSVSIRTPFQDFNKVGANFIHSGNNEKFACEGTLNYMDGKQMIGKVDFFRFQWRRIDASVELTTPFQGLENSKAEFNYEDNSNVISTTAALEYNNGQKLNGNVKLTTSPNYEVQVTLNSPFSKVIRAQGTLDMTAPNYEAISTFSYGRNQAYSTVAKLNLYHSAHMDGSVEVTTPISGFESTKVEYKHKAEDSQLDGFLALTYHNGKTMSCDIRSVISPNFDGTITVKTPSKTMSGSATYEHSFNKYETTSSLNLDDGIVYTMTSELDYSLEPMKFISKINTPFQDWRNVDLELTHEGGLTSFVSTGLFSSPITKQLNCKVNLKYESLMDMTAGASVQTSLEGFDDLKAEVKTTDVAGEKKANLVFGWTSGEQMTFDSTFRSMDGWNEDKVHADVSVSTPFVAVRSANMQYDHSVKSDSYTNNVKLGLNGDSLLDFDTEMNLNDQQSAELVVRQPWNMQYTASKSNTDGTTNTEVFANWNRNELDSSVRVKASLTDKSNKNKMNNGLDLSIEHASRTVGVVHQFSQESAEVSSNGYVYWGSDATSKLSYDMQLNDNSRRGKHMSDGRFKLGLPSRTLGLTGSISNGAKLSKADATFSWDADRDDSKQVGIKTTLKTGNSLKGDVTLSLPSLRKEIRVDGEVMMLDGRVLFDTKTDISYSKDSRKTLTLTSKLMDVSDSNAHFNYSLSLGLKHPHTNVDMAINSHLGKSDKSMSFGMDTHYLTSKREMKNLALLSEINMLKKQITVQVFNPTNKMEMVGDIVSEKPCKMRLVNRINDVEAFRTDMTFDSAKKSFILNAFTDSDIVTFSAKYPNTTAFHVDLTRHSPDFDQTEALMAVRLNSSQLMHTRLSWRPQMMKEFDNFVRSQLAQNAEAAIVEISEMNDAFADELASKYAAIVDELSEELSPYIGALENELAFIAEKMNEMSEDLEKMYYNNDLYFQNMGQGVLVFKAKMDKLTKQFTTISTERISSLRESLYDMSRYHAGARYKHFITQSAGKLVKQSMDSLAALELYMAESDLVLQEYKDSLIQMKQRAMGTVFNATYIDYLGQKLREIQTTDISPYVSSFNIPTQYTNVASSIPEQLHTKMNQALDQANMQFVKEGLNEVYQQSAWAYNYWQLEENIQKHAKSMLKHLKEIVEVELKQYAEELKMLLRNPITVWDPEHGEIQADIPLPIAVKRLDRMPDFKPLVKKAQKFVDTYTPDQKTLDKLVESVSDMWSEKSNVTDEQLSKYRPSKKYRKKGRKYRVKINRQ